METKGRLTIIKHGCIQIITINVDAFREISKTGSNKIFKSIMEDLGGYDYKFEKIF